VSVVSFPPSGKASSIYVARSTDDGRTWSRFVPAVPDVGLLPAAALPNTSFRDGIVESFAASRTHPGHLYLTYEDWDGSQFDVYFTQSVDHGATWTEPARVNDNASPAATDQFQPSVAEGPGGVVAVAFYDRRPACPDDPSVLPADRGRTNFCIDVSVQAYRDSARERSGSGRTCAPLPSPGTRRIRPNTSVASGRWRAPATTTPACSRSSATTSGSRSLPATSTCCPCPLPVQVVADEGGPVYYQQQVLSTLSRTALGIA
jgi:hypothetical protein